MKNTFLVVLVCVIVFCITSCHKSYTTFSPIDPYLLAHYNFQPGTYWIYRDSVTGKEDSIIVYRNERDTFFEKGNSQYGEYIRMSTRIFRDSLIDTGLFHIDANTIRFDDGTERGYMFGYVNTTITADTTVLGMVYKNIKKYRYSEFHSFCSAEDIGILQYNTCDSALTNKYLKQLIRYRIIK
ncbi:hypothetical protein CJD36_008755 [Flavipsychrobacter stenotrophus]|uniref:Uncharacterized protein n=1 Tax=Flavipsychrobacter stenotrophus TaxID=2077091 RepID=A0A2S7SYS9_9BACT|nr:hypothetical protein [Flavipsychrobacter stenotrophus]PQJ11874.1 hypothetical protein CJD36_008755 [Flavipsychrobacter stenotrophus]